ncbi:NTP transferase domain-containing protein [Amylibacter sp. SFDW26]|uniref:NTP transferase domain-containing protein n=1 Tax=Amylibacter sp. SFDW26 TaxID=2652722 RepID=UPI00126145D8|nr:molybdopterin-binding/glycosyltransferase family 2 protein [Amylibacter sp. SFDW26]KAB7615983.1 NTP transferase domain-containing protein [Amylibacter sp. SFDW26]
MKFQSVELAQAQGHILAHSAKVKNGLLKKGSVLSGADIQSLSDMGQNAVTVAILEQGDVAENDAVQILADAFTGTNIEITPPVAGRINLIAQCDGILSLNAETIDSFNAVDEAITIATLPNYARVRKGMLLATLKIISYAVQDKLLKGAINLIDDKTIEIQSFTRKSCDIILTKIDGFKPSLLTKAETVIRTRVAPLNLHVEICSVVSHTEEAVADALNKTTNEMVLILGASATSDRNDVIPAAIVTAGGSVTRFGMPVDPGNLLVLAEYKGRSVVGLPGCARSPAINGVDWVLERLCANLSVGMDDVAKMGVGGLLKEIPDRIQPRLKKSEENTGATVIMLAAGRSRRMRGDDKLLRTVNGIPLLRHCVQTALASNANECVVVINKGAIYHREALDGLPVKIIEANDADLGMSASLRAGVLGLDHTPTSIFVAFADMPDLTKNHFNTLINKYNDTQGKPIICPVTQNGSSGHPVLFDAAYLENLTALEGDVGAKSILKSVSDAVHEVQMDDAVVLDLDTPEAWAAWEAKQP